MSSASGEVDPGEPDPRERAAEERLRGLIRQLEGDSPRSWDALCRHVLADRTYADSTRALFAEIREQVRATLGRS